MSKFHPPLANSPMAMFLAELEKLCAAHQVSVTSPRDACFLMHCEGARYTVTNPAPNAFVVTSVIAGPSPVATESLELVCRTKNWPALRAACLSVRDKHALDRRFVEFLTGGYMLCEREEWVVPVNVHAYGDLLVAMTLRGLEFLVRARAKDAGPSDTEPPAP